MAKLGYSDIIAMDIDMGDYGTKYFFNDAITENHVCINDAVLSFDENYGFRWATTDGRVTIGNNENNVSGVTARLYFGIPVN